MSQPAHEIASVLAPLSLAEKLGTSTLSKGVHLIGSEIRCRTLTYAGSNYSMPPPGVSAAANMQKENAGYSALGPSVEAAYKVGSAVVLELLSKWSVYRDHSPAQ